MTDQHDGTTCACACHDGPQGLYACSMVGGCGLAWAEKERREAAAATPAPAVPEPEDYVALDGSQACVFGCKDRGEHRAGCPCHDACPEHTGHCGGCAPRPAHGTSLLCGHCFHRRLRAPLRRAPALFDWLTSRKGGLKAQDYAADRVSSSKEAPLPFNVGVVDHLTLMEALLRAWVKRALETAPPGPGPALLDVCGCAEWLDSHSSWISEQPWVLGFIAHLRGLEDRARRLAPWQPTRHALPMPCLRCEQQTLVLFGGEDWVTCTNPECDEIIGWYRYTRLSRAIAGVREQDAQEVG